MFAASKSSKAAAGGGGTTDASFAYVPLLLETTSTNGQQNNTFLDSSTNNFTITRNGTPTQGSITPYWPNGQWSNYFNGSTDYLTAPTNAAFQFPGDFSVEGFCFPYSFASEQVLFDGLQSGGNFLRPDTFLLVANATTGTLRIFTNSAYSSPTSNALSLNSWNHWAIIRTGTTVSIFINGTRGFTTTLATNFSSGGCFIARYSDSVFGWGLYYASNVRIVKGSNPSGYSATNTSLTVPTSPLTAISGTSLLTCQSNRFIDNGTANSGQPFAITVNGIPTVQTFQPFSPAASYTTGLYGGSAYFNGSTDYLTAPSSAAFAFGTGDFTVEAWVYITSISASRGIFDSRTSGNEAAGFTFYTDTSGFLNIRNDATIAVASKAIIVNSWNHCAVTRSGTSLTIWLNGISVAAASNSTNFSLQNCFIGRAYIDPFDKMLGYISNHRVVKGTAVYTANFTPPTAPVTNITNTSLLLNMTNAGIYDAATQSNLITVGSSQVNISQSKWPPSSMFFDGDGDYCDVSGSNQIFNLSSGDWTIEAWIYRNSANRIDVILNLFNAINTTSGLTFFVNGSNQLIADNGVTGAIAGGTVPSNQWVYLAIVRSGGTTTGYINGTSVGTTTQAPNAAQYARIGFFGNSGAPSNWAFNGYIQDLRITKGVARTITTPTAAFPTR
jgi:hypothetical protein